MTRKPTFDFSFRHIFQFCCILDPRAQSTPLFSSLNDDTIQCNNERERKK